MKELDSQIKKMIVPIVEVMKGKIKGQIVLADGLYECGYTIRRSTGIAKDELENLRLLHPDIYDTYTKTRESQSFYIKKKR